MIKFQNKPKLKDKFRITFNQLSQSDHTNIIPGTNETNI